MQTANEIMAEIQRVERQIEGPEGKGKLTVLKAYHRKLARQYMKLIGA